MQVPEAAGILTALAAVTVAAVGCDPSAPSLPAAIIEGTRQPLGEGSVHSWVSLDPAGQPSALGITLTAAALAALSAERPLTLTLPLPPEAAATAFEHLELEWLPRGHAPAGLLDRPHLDVRFFTLSPQEREELHDAQEAVRVPALELIPEGYVPLPGWVPRLGSRWSDLMAPELSGEPLTGSLLYGYYGGRLVVLEQSVTRLFLEGKPDLVQELKLPRSYARPGYYPTRSRVRYDPRAREYSIALEGLVRRP